MRILAIDPGTDKSAFVRWDSEKNDFMAGDKMGLFANFDLLHALSFLANSVDLVAIEMVQSYGGKFSVGREVFETCLWAGRFCQIVNGLNLPIIPEVKFYGRPTIKGAVGGRTDAEIRASLRMRYGEAKKGCKLEGVKADIWAALALACALAENHNLKEW